LALPHQIWTGADFTANAAARAYWWTLYAAALVAVLVYRVGRPVALNLRHRLRVERVVAEGPGVVSIHVTGRDLHAFPAGAGQFLVWRFWSGRGRTRGHPFSLSAAPDGRSLRITIKDLGDDFTRIATLPPGTRALVEGPYGRLTAAVRTRRKVTLIGSGIGITPLRALLEELDFGPGEATLIYRASRPEDLVFRGELDALAAARGARVYYAVGHRVPDRDSWLPASAAGRSEVGALLALVPDIAEHDVYLCGAQPWMDAARRAARMAGVPSKRIHIERFAW
jgi:ferredoxin-NADP reductase